MRAFRLLGLAALVLGARAARAQQAPAASLNQLARIQVVGDAVEITCAQRPNFTTLNLVSPPRLVLDFADTVLAEPAHALAVALPGVTALRTEAFRSETSAVARVTLTLAPDADADIAAAPGNTLRVKVVVGSGSAVARGAAEPRPDDFARADEKAKQRAEEQRQAQARAETDAKIQHESQARAEAEARAAAESQARAAAEAKAHAAEERLAQLEAQKRSADEARAAAEARAREEARAAEEAQARTKAAQEQARLAQVEKDRLEHERQEAARLEKERQEKERLQQEQAARERLAQERAAVARAEAEQAERDRRAAVAQAEAEQAERDRRLQSQREAQARLDAEARAQKEEREARLKVRAESEARAEAEHLAAQRASEREVHLAQARAAAAAPIAPRAEVRVASVSPPEHVTIRPGVKDISLVGYRQGTGTHHVFIKANDAVAYTVTRSSPTRLVVEVQGARISQKNGVLPLDTSFFPGPVSMVVPSEDRRAHLVRVEIQLKGQADYTARLDGSEVVVDFPEGR